MDALDESGYATNTLVIFLSDNGMAVPFAKANAYLASTLTPLMVRFPGEVETNSVDHEHFVSGIDLLPTILEITGHEPPERLDGKSFLPLLKGETQTGRDKVFTQIDKLITAGAYYPMRCVQDESYGYIFNPWSNGETFYENNNEGSTMTAMEQAAETDPEIAARVDMFRYRVLEEFYDLENDPDCLNNLIDDAAVKEEKNELVAELVSWMEKTDDPFLPAIANKVDRKTREAVIDDVLDYTVV